MRAEAGSGEESPRSGPPSADGAGPGERRSRGRRRRPFRRGRVLTVVLLGVAGAIAAVGILVPPADRSVADGTPTAAGRDAPTPTGGVTPTPTPTPTPAAPAPPVLRLSGPVPSTGSGAFTYAPGQGRAAGRAGTLRRYRVAMERETDEDVREVAAKVDAALADPRGWTGSGRLRLQRVPNGGGHDFTVYLVTAGTAQRMCAESGVNIRVGGKPYTSCRGTGRVIINLDRWRLSVPHFVSAKVPLEVYRNYVVNHEVGHELGHRHERCPGRGKAAPVMMQQTLFLNGCRANPWPYLGGKRHAGPPL